MSTPTVSRPEERFPLTPTRPTHSSSVQSAERQIGTKVLERCLLTIKRAFLFNTITTSTRTKIQHFGPGL